jgi:hypothetical protein
LIDFRLRLEIRLWRKVLPAKGLRPLRRLMALRYLRVLDRSVVDLDEGGEWGLAAAFEKEQAGLREWMSRCA